MDYGVCLPNFPDGASREGLEASAEAAERLGWSTAWTTDHVLVNRAAAAEYGSDGFDPDQPFGDDGQDYAETEQL